ncbi:hypothetical protein MSAN_02340100 [Mycena sanguinolenta]|uniref:Uncharacterized protein n=1 Tax=Mycena sanguinolenta TaxID=230812 RepID=A0A8H6X6U8_9AGAR|nr:hypothetical protein MSAN_02340100 [Mycena sanguinolenta]
MQEGSRFQPQGGENSHGTLHTGVSQTSRPEKPHQAWKKLSRWLKGPDTVMDLDVDPEQLEACKKEWVIKWQKYCEEFPEESLDHIQGMGQVELRERSHWLETEFTRLRENIPVLNNDTNDPEVIAGLAFVGELLDGCRADLVRVMAAGRTTDIQSASNSTPPIFQVPVEQFKNVERSHMFALSCTNKIVTMKQARAMRRQQQIPANSQHSKSNQSSLRQSMSSENLPPEADEEAANEMQGMSISALESQTLPRSLPATAVTFTSNNIGQNRLYGHRGNNQRQQNPLTVVSSSSSHMKNLTALIGIAFFGASITWSTIFSGTRGDLVLISWSACLFIVGAVGAAAASMLVIPEEDIVAKYDTVRWTVRILSLVSMAHVLAGMFLIAVAILVLDPRQQSPQALAGKAGMQSAGAYAIAVSVLCVGVSGAVWRRHTTRTWFAKKSGESRSGHI